MVPTLALMFVVPLPVAVTSPLPLMVATAVFDEFHAMVAVTGAPDASRACAVNCAVRLSAPNAGAAAGDVMTTWVIDGSGGGVVPPPSPPPPHPAAASDASIKRRAVFIEAQRSPRPEGPSSVPAVDSVHAGRHRANPEGVEYRSETMFELIGTAAALGAGIAGYVSSKDFTRRKLRFVDAAHTPAAAIVAGVGAAVIAAPIVWLLPIVGAGTALLLGAGVGLGVRSGQKDRHLLP